MADRRNGVSEAGRSEEDPFAELVRLVERPELFANGPLRSPPPRAEEERSFGGFEPVEIPSRDWDEFDYQGEVAARPGTASRDEADAFARGFDAEHRNPVSADAVGHAPRAFEEHAAPDRIVARGAPAEPEADRHGFAAAPAWIDDVPEDSGIDEALLGLSAPMSPRDSHPGETGSFAPERREIHHEAPARAITLDDFDELIASELAVMRPNSYGAGAPSLEPDYLEADGYAPDEDDRAGYRAVPRGRMFAGGSNRRRLLFFGGGVAAVALVGLFGAYSFLGPAGTSAAGDEPILIKAEAEPVKIAPENPGGRSVPNQNKAVYERVARNGPPQGPTQEMLISAAEEPIDLALDEEVSDLPGVMVGVPDLPMEGEVEVAQAELAPAQPVLQPHRVKTYDVRPDGTLVPRDDAGAASPTPTPAPASNVGETVAAGAIDPVAGIRPTMPLSVEEALKSAALTPASSANAAPAAAAASDTAAAPAAPAAPEAAAPPVPPAEPAPAAAQEVAAIQPAPAAPPPEGSVFVQISSQPSQELAEQSRDNLASRYASVIGGRSLTIQSAEIPDRGTYYRVRIVTASADEANSVCQSLQSAGGSCFVTR